MEREILRRFSEAQQRFGERARQHFEGLGDERTVPEPAKVVETKRRHLATLQLERESIVQARDLAVARAEEILRDLDETIGRLDAEIAGDRKIVDNLSALQKNLRVVTGQVRLPDGTPAAGVTMTLTDQRGPMKASLHRVTTDDDGIFSFQVKPKEFEEFFRTSSNLVLVAQGGPHGVNHMDVRPVGNLEQPFRLIDIRLRAADQVAAAPSAAESIEALESGAVSTVADLGASEHAARKVYLATGARSGLVRRLQTRLEETGFSPRGIDGDFGGKTRTAIEAFQRDRGLTASGEVDEVTWRALFDADPPSVAERSLAVTASFEGHGFTHAAGNWDDAGITWGIVGFTLRHGGLGEVVRRVHESHPALLAEDFGPQRAQTLLEALGKPPDERVAWADTISLKDDKTGLHKPWREAFAAFGARPEVQAAQIAVADEEYSRPARNAAAALGLVSELGYALAFDAQVQNGGVKTAARRQIERARAEREPADERELRRLVARAVADNALERFRQDVLDRKLTFAEGEGTVHGRRYVLRSWGLDETPAA